MNKVKQSSQVNQVNWAKLFSHFLRHFLMASLSTTIVLQAPSQNGQGPALTWQYIEVTETADGQNISHRDLWSQISLPGRQTRADRSICLPGISGHLISCFFHSSQFPFPEAAPPLELRIYLKACCWFTEHFVLRKPSWSKTWSQMHAICESLLNYVSSFNAQYMQVTHIYKYHKYTTYISGWQFYFLHVSPNDGERAQRVSAN